MTSGYSLLELLVAMAVIALVSGVVGSLQSAPQDGRRLDAEAVEVQTFLQQAQVRAQRTGRRVAVNVSPHRDGLASDDAHELPVDAEIDGPSIMFDASGFSNGGDLSLGQAGQELIVSVEPLSGRVSRGGSR